MKVSYFVDSDGYALAVFGLIKGFDENNDSKISFGEFVSSLWTLERRDEEIEIAQVS